MEKVKSQVVVTEENVLSGFEEKKVEKLVVVTETVPVYKRKKRVHLDLSAEQAIYIAALIGCLTLKDSKTGGFIHQEIHGDLYGDLCDAGVEIKVNGNYAINLDISNTENKTKLRGLSYTQANPVYTLNKEIMKKLVKIFNDKESD